MSPRRIASPFPTLRPVRLTNAVLRPTKPAARPPRSSVAARVGATVRLLRKLRGTSAQALAQRAGLSRSLLSRLERGLVSPSLDTLESLAAALDVSGARLLHGQADRQDFCHVPAGRGLPVHRSEGEGWSQEILGQLQLGLQVVEPWLVVQRPMAARAETARHAGIRFLYVLSGRGVCAHGSREVHVRAGDALMFDANVPHGIWAQEGHAVAHLSVLFSLRD
jgi:transcriptional regulator with XRE-family HTH domain